MNTINEKIDNKISVNKPETRHINNCCGFISIFNGMKCEASEILLQYKIENVSDLLNLLIYGKDEYPSIYNMFLNREEGIDMFNEMVDKKITKLKWHNLLDYQQKIFEKNTENPYRNNTSVGIAFFGLVSLYFKIHFRMIGKGDDEERTYIKRTNKWLDGYNFKTSIPITITSNHVQFEPNYDKKTEALKFDLLKKLYDYQKNQMEREETCEELAIEANYEMFQGDHQFEAMTKEEQEEQEEIDIGIAKDREFIFGL